MKKLRASFYGKKVYSRNSIHLGQEDMGDERLKTKHMVYTEQVKLRDKPTFFKILKKIRKSAQHFEERNPDMSRALMMLKDKRREGRVAKL